MGLSHLKLHFSHSWCVCPGVRVCVCMCVFTVVQPSPPGPQKHSFLLAPFSLNKQSRYLGEKRYSITIMHNCIIFFLKYHQMSYNECIL